MSAYGYDIEGFDDAFRFSSASDSGFDFGAMMPNQQSGVIAQSGRWSGSAYQSVQAPSRTPSTCSSVTDGYYFIPQDEFMPSTRRQTTPELRRQRAMRKRKTGNRASRTMERSSAPQPPSACLPPPLPAPEYIPPLSGTEVSHPASAKKALKFDELIHLPLRPGKAPRTRVPATDSRPASPRPPSRQRRQAPPPATKSPKAPTKIQMPSRSIWAEAPAPTKHKPPQEEMTLVREYQLALGLKINSGLGTENERKRASQPVRAADPAVVEAQRRAVSLPAVVPIMQKTAPGTVPQATRPSEQPTVHFVGEAVATSSDADDAPWPRRKVTLSNLSMVVNTGRPFDDESDDDSTSTGLSSCPTHALPHLDAHANLQASDRTIVRAAPPAAAAPTYAPPPPAPQPAQASTQAPVAAPAHVESRDRAVTILTPSASVQQGMPSRDAARNRAVAVPELTGGILNAPPTAAAPPPPPAKAAPQALSPTLADRFITNGMSVTMSSESASDDENRQLGARKKALAAYKFPISPSAQAQTGPKATASAPPLPPPPPAPVLPPVHAPQAAPVVPAATTSRDVLDGLAQYTKVAVSPAPPPVPRAAPAPTQKGPTQAPAPRPAKVVAIAAPDPVVASPTRALSPVTPLCVETMVSGTASAPTEVDSFPRYSAFSIPEPLMQLASAQGASFRRLSTTTPADEPSLQRAHSLGRSGWGYIEYFASQYRKAVSASIAGTPARLSTEGISRSTGTIGSSTASTPVGSLGMPAERNHSASSFAETHVEEVFADNGHLLHAPTRSFLWRRDNNSTTTTPPTSEPVSTASTPGSTDEDIDIDVAADSMRHMVVPVRRRRNVSLAQPGEPVTKPGDNNSVVRADPRLHRPRHALPAPRPPGRPFSAVAADARPMKPSLPPQAQLQPSRQPSASPQVHLQPPPPLKKVRLPMPAPPPAQPAPPAEAPNYPLKNFQPQWAAPFPQPKYFGLPDPVPVITIRQWERLFQYSLSEAPFVDSPRLPPSNPADDKQGRRRPKT